MGMDAPVRRTMAKTRCQSHIQVRDRSQVYSVYSRHYTRVKGQVQEPLAEPKTEGCLSLIIYHESQPLG